MPSFKIELTFIDHLQCAKFSANHLSTIHFINSLC